MSLQHWMNCVWAHYVVCQYQLKGQFYVTTCSHCFKPFANPLPVYTPYALSFSVYAFCLAAFYYAKPYPNLLFIIGMSLLIYFLLIYACFYRNIACA